jgi:hypothetical protein
LFFIINNYKYLEISSFLSNKEIQYIEDKFKDYMLLSEYNKKYYNFIVISNNTILIIVKKRFLNFLAESKENLLEFSLNAFVIHRI